MKKYFITGLVILLPLAVTIAIVLFIVNFLTNPFIGVVSRILYNIGLMKTGLFFLSPEQIITYTSRILILITLFLFTVGIGVITRWFFIKGLLSFSDRILHRIPVVNSVYKTTQEIIKTLLSGDKKSFKQVVMVPFPRKDIYVMGFISGDSPARCSQVANEELVSVMIPTTPNPTTGFLLMYPKKEIISLDLTPEDAIKYIVSCGMIIPPLPQQTPSPSP